jgi:hypothetical protein
MELLRTERSGDGRGHSRWSGQRIFRLPSRAGVLLLTSEQVLNAAAPGLGVLRPQAPNAEVRSDIRDRMGEHCGLDYELELGAFDAPIFMEQKRASLWHA